MKEGIFILVGAFLFAIGKFNLRAQQGTDASGGGASGSGGTVYYSIGQINFNSITEYFSNGFPKITFGGLLDSLLNQNGL